MLQEYVKEVPDDLEMSEFLFWYYVINGQYQDAVDLLTIIVAINASTEFYLYRAWVLRYLNRLNDAEKDLTIYLELANDPCPWEVHFERGECRVQLGDRVGAEHDAIAIDDLLPYIQDATLQQEAFESIDCLLAQIENM